MISKLQIKNFQAHKDLRLELHPNVTTITGASDVGKSSVMRALRWVCMNLPRGKAHIRAGAKAASVSILVDGKKITRRRSSTDAENSYAINGSELVAFGADVPDEVVRTLQVNSVNFQSQHDAPFWLSESPPEVSRQLNQIINLSIIDSSLSNVGKEVRRAKAEYEVSKKRLDEAHELCGDLEYVPELVEDFESLVGEEDRHGELLDRAESLEENLEKVTRASKKYTELKKQSGFEEFSLFEQAFTDFQTALKKRCELEDQIVKVEQSQKRVAQSVKDLERIEKNHKHKLEGEECPLCKRKM